jgi:indolepyruvate ferredoxin oxidoreductase beta subunit
MDVPRHNILLAGVGGQGVLVASEIVARVAIAGGCDAKKSEVHGVAQRGGSVVSHVRFGRRVYSPLAMLGDVDLLIAFERLEGLRWAHYVEPAGRIVLNDHKIPPVQFGDEKREYPEDVSGFLSEKGFDIWFVPGTDVAKELGNVRAANSVILGVAATLLEFDIGLWERTLAEALPPKVREVNLAALSRGIELAPTTLLSGSKRPREIAAGRQ